MCAARWCSHPSPSQAGSWFWEQSPAWLHFHLNSFPLQDRVLISRLSMETIPPVVFAPELVSGEHELAGPKWSRGTIVRVHQNQFRGPATFPWCIDKNQFLWGKWFYRDEIWVNPAFDCWRKFVFPVVPSTWLLVAIYNTCFQIKGFTSIFGVFLFVLVVFLRQLNLIHSKTFTRG